MKNQDIMDVLDLLEDKVAECDLLGSKQHKYLLTLAQLKVQFKTVTVNPKFKEVYDSLVVKGKKMASLFRIDADPKDLNGKLSYYINYMNAALGDFTGQTYRITVFYRLFLICAILFMLLSPQFLTPIFSIIFIVPIILAMKGIKQRSKNGFWLAMLMAPASLMASVLWVRYGVHIVSNLSQAIAEMMQAYQIGEGFATALTVACPILGSILFVLAIVLIVYGNKVKNLFV